jgi:hypothetical protein
MKRRTCFRLFEGEGVLFIGAALVSLAYGASPLTGFSSVLAAGWLAEIALAVLASVANRLRAANGA